MKQTIDAFKINGKFKTEDDHINDCQNKLNGTGNFLSFGYILLILTVAVFYFYGKH